MKRIIGFVLSLYILLSSFPVFAGTAFDQTVNIINIESGTSDSEEKIIISADSEIKDFSTTEYNNPSRLAIDIKGAVLKFQNKSLDVKGDYVNKIRSAQNNTSPYITRIVADLEYWTEYKATLSDDRKKLILCFNKKPADITCVGFSKTDNADSISVDMKYYRKPVISSLSSSNKIVFDIPMSKFSNVQSSISANGMYIKSVKCSQIDNSNARLEINLKSGCLIECKDMDKGFEIEISSPNSKNITYSDGKAPVLAIENERIGFNYFNYKFKNEGSKFILTVPSKTFGIDNGRLVINDKKVDFVDFIKNDETQTTDLVLNAKKASNYSIDSVQDNNRLIIETHTGDKADDSGKIKINKKAKNKLVIIDPGHGGNENGAIYPLNESDPKLIQVKEKDLNLDISLKLFEMLKSAGVNAQLTRQDDRSVELAGRADLANSQNASLFVSVHNNSGSDGENGTMTLYYPSSYDNSYGITGETAARIAQEELLKNLGTTDRGVWKRPRLAVLNNSNMPAIIAEIAYISNNSDRSKLLTDEFRKKAAEALCNAIIKILNKTIEDNSSNKDDVNSQTVNSEKIANLSQDDLKERNINGFAVPPKAEAKCGYKGNNPETPSVFDLSISLDYNLEKNKIATLDLQRQEAEKVLSSKLDVATLKKVMDVAAGLKDLNSYFWEDEIENDSYKIWVRCIHYTGICTIDVIHK